MTPEETAKEIIETWPEPHDHIGLAKAIDEAVARVHLIMKLPIVSDDDYRLLSSLTDEP